MFIFTLQQLRPILLISCVLVLVSISSCENFLDEKPFKSMAVPRSLDDVQALMDNRNVMNFQTSNLPEVLADNYYATATHWLGSTDDARMNYIWHPESQSTAWNNIYQGLIYYANIGLDLLESLEISDDEQSRKSQLMGAALFYRSFGFYELAQLFCRPYSSTASTDNGLPLRTKADVNLPFPRATVAETYDRIISDLKRAVLLLPSETIYPTRPTKAAAYALLARCYLSMRSYGDAGLYADSCLMMKNELIDYNQLSNSAGPFRRFNEETIFYSFCGSTLGILHSTRGKIDSNLYASYHEDDLRKRLFFQANTGANSGTYRFKGCYDGDYFPNGVFNGLATNEMYLISAESHARTGNTAKALEKLNVLMKTRWDNSVDYLEFTASDAHTALKIILDERRKELLYRNLRWSDLRRFNEEGSVITLVRDLDGERYTLSPGDPRWVSLLPDEVVSRSNVKQNAR